MVFFAEGRPVAEVMDLGPDTREMTLREYEARGCDCCGQVNCVLCTQAERNLASVARAAAELVRGGR